MVPPCKTSLMSLSVRNSSMQTLKPTQEEIFHNPFYSHRQTVVLIVAIWGNLLRKLSLDECGQRAFCCIHWFSSLDFLEILKAQQQIIFQYYNLAINGIWNRKSVLICSQYDLFTSLLKSLLEDSKCQTLIWRNRVKARAKHKNDDWTHQHWLEEKTEVNKDGKSFFQSVHTYSACVFLAFVGRGHNSQILDDFLGVFCLSSTWFTTRKKTTLNDKTVFSSIE